MGIQIDERGNSDSFSGERTKVFLVNSIATAFLLTLAANLSSYQWINACRSYLSHCFIFLASPSNPMNSFSVTMPHAKSPNAWPLDRKFLSPLCLQIAWLLLPWTDNDAFSVLSLTEFPCELLLSRPAFARHSTSDVVHALRWIIVHLPVKRRWNLHWYPKKRSEHNQLIDFRATNASQTQKSFSLLYFILFNFFNLWIQSMLQIYTDILRHKKALTQIARNSYNLLRFLEKDYDWPWIIFCNIEYLSSR